MKFTLENLPDDVSILHKMINDLSSKVLSLSTENDSLKSQLALLKNKQFGNSSEKLKKQIEDLEVRIEDNEESEKTPTEDDAAKDVADFNVPASTQASKEKRQPKRNSLPEHLPREDKIINPEPKCTECGGEEFRKIADDISEILEYVPSSLKVIRIIRPRCACVGCEKIIQAEVPEKVIAKGKVGPGFLARVLVNKYCDHLPLYRQSQIYAREGVDLSRSTMASWVGQCARLLDLLNAELRKYVFASEQIHGDDTPVRVLDPEVVGKTRTGRFWAYVRDGRPHGDASPPAVCYFYSPDRKGEHPRQHLQNFKGTLHADAYAGFDQIYAGDVKTINEAACWAHVRRKFHEVTVAVPNAGIATEAMEKIGALYAIEDEIRGLDPKDRLKKRKEQSVKIVDEFFLWLKKMLPTLPKTSQTAKAINYAMNLQQALRLFCTDGQIEIDNNAAERALRIVALGRKNWLFVGSDWGGKTAASIYSLTETAKLNGINPQEYLTKVLDVIASYNSQKLADLLPWNLIKKIK